MKLQIVNKKLQGDAFEILSTLGTGSFDLVLTDPPYNFKREQIIWLSHHFDRITKSASIVFCPPENQWLGYPSIYYFWQKSISTKNTSKRPSRFMEMILVFGDYKWNTGRHWSQYTNVFNDLVDDSKIHPFRKPPSLIERLILNHSDPGDEILDPFAGSHVVSQVANRLGRYCTSIEIEEEAKS